MRGLEDVAPPNVRVACQVQVYAFMRRTLNSDLLNAGHVQVVSHPPSQVLVGGLLHLLFEQAVVELGDSRLKGRAQSVDLTSGELRPAGRQRAAHIGQKAVPMEPAGPVADRQDVDVTCGLKTG
jgi:hypothetical protein